MSNAATALVWQSSKATGNALLVLLAIAEHVNKDGKAWPSIARLARYCRMTERSVLRNLAVLEGSKEIIRTTSQGRVTHYEITLTHDASVTHDATVTPDASVTPPMTLASPTHDASVILTVKNRNRTVNPPYVPPWQEEDENDERGSKTGGIVVDAGSGESHQPGSKGVEAIKESAGEHRGDPCENSEEPAKPSCAGSKTLPYTSGDREADIAALDVACRAQIAKFQLQALGQTAHSLPAGDPFAIAIARRRAKGLGRRSEEVH